MIKFSLLIAPLFLFSCGPAPAPTVVHRMPAPEETVKDCNSTTIMYDYSTHETMVVRDSNNDNRRTTNDSHNDSSSKTTENNSRTTEDSSKTTNNNNNVSVSHSDDTTIDKR